MKTTAAMLTTLALTVPLASPAAESLQAVAAGAPAIMIPVHTALLMKQELDNHALFVDVDSAPDRLASLRVDALVPLHAADAPESFNGTSRSGEAREAWRRRQLTPS